MGTWTPRACILQAFSKVLKPFTLLQGKSPAQRPETVSWFLGLDRDFLALTVSEFDLEATKEPLQQRLEYWSLNLSSNAVGVVPRQVLACPMTQV